MKVLFMTNMPSPYRVDFFNELGKQCELTVLFETKTAKSRDEAWLADNIQNFKAVFLKGIRIGEAEAFCPGVLKFLSTKKYDIIVVGLYSSPTGMMAIEYMRLRRIPFLLSSDGGMKKADSGFKYKFKKHFISAASAWLSTGKVTTEYLTYYGAKEERIYKYPFTSVKQKDILEKPLTPTEKQVCKDELGMREDKVVLSVGQFIYRKGYDVLLRACKDLNGNIGVYIVGGKATEEYLQLQQELGLPNVHFVDFMKKEQLAEYYKAADLFVLPTREDIWGLVINEAMAYGLPVITTDKCVAGVEMVKPAVNGEIIVNTPERWAQAIEKFFMADCDWKTMCDKSLTVARAYSIENMATRHISVFQHFKEIV